MKTFYILFLLLFSSSFIFPQWTNLNPVPNGNTLRSVFFIDDNTGWMVGSDGFIIKTTNAGVDWIEQISGTTTYLKSVEFVDENNGWAVGESGLILKTTDGGLNWSPQNSGTEEILNCVFFYNTNIGWASGCGGVVLKTSDGGANWTFQVIDASFVFSSVHFIDQSTGWVVGRVLGTIYKSEDSAIILKTTNGGQDWVVQSHPLSNNSRLYSVQFLDENNGWAVGGIDFGIEAPSVILNTTNGGSDWTLRFTGWPTGLKISDQPYNDEQSGFKSVFFKDEMNGVVVGGDKGGWFTYIVSTTDGGGTWTEKYAVMEFKPALYSVFVTNDGKGWAVGEDGFIIISDDNGNSWSEQLSGSGYEIISQFFTNEQEGWISGISNGNRPFIMKTSNSGKVWKTQYSGIYMEGSINSLFFYNNQIGWAGGDEGLLKTNNGGFDWIKFGGLQISSVFFINQNTGWIISNGNIYKSTNGGLTFTKKSDGKFSSICFVDDLNGWVVGEDGCILKSTDGGENWIHKTSGTTSNLNCIKFLDNNVGISVGSFGTFLLSTDGGEIWTLKNSSTTEQLNSIAFSNPTSAWISGINGKLFNTTDLGNDWTTYDGITRNNINSVFFVNENSGWFVGGNGTMFKIENNTVIPVELIYLNALVAGGEIKLKWQTASEINNSGFAIERKQDRDDELLDGWVNIGFIAGNGTTSEFCNYIFYDNLNISGSYQYRLKQIDYDGKFNYSMIINVEFKSPIKLELMQNFPNPFNPSTIIRYQVPEDSKVVIKIYNILGSEIMELINEQKVAGIYEVKFNAVGIASGTYIYRIISGSFIDEKKMILLK